LGKVQDNLGQLKINVKILEFQVCVQAPSFNVQVSTFDSQASIWSKLLRFILHSQGTSTLEGLCMKVHKLEDNIEHCVLRCIILKSTIMYTWVEVLDWRWDNDLMEFGSKELYCIPYMLQCVANLANILVVWIAFWLTQCSLFQQWKLFCMSYLDFGSFQISPKSL
jgi:hypothetical protein